MDAQAIVFIDAEVTGDGKHILDLGAVTGDGREFHSGSLPAFTDFLRGSKYICGHNILRHDLIYLEREIGESGAEYFIDTLYLSPLLFPKKPYHRLVKDDKLCVDELNNPLNDVKKARDLFYDEISALNAMEPQLRRIYAGLLRDTAEFSGFFRFAGYGIISDSAKTAGIGKAYGSGKAPKARGLLRLLGLEKKPHGVAEASGTPGTSEVSETAGMPGTAALILEAFAGRICANAPLERLITERPTELAYALAQISVIKQDSMTPPWVLKNYPYTENILQLLRNRKCPSCAYCDEALDETRALRRFFHYDAFRVYEGLPLQQSAVKAAVAGRSLLSVFPTGGGKSITFQLPALMAGASEKGLTVVISPLQSLMKDQTDNLERQHNITEAVTVNGSLDPIERANAFARVEDGSASLLYIAPESLRSTSVERLLLGRNVVRFVIDEAHCFSSWGQDFRVDYLYIGDFIRSLREKKGMTKDLPVSCFTATAKPQVIADILEYFRSKLSLDLEVFQAGTGRTNLRYHLFPEEDGSAKQLKLRQLLADRECPAIIYVSRVVRSEKLAAALRDAGFPALPYHGKMDRRERGANQEAFMAGSARIMVATTAFGMGVDKKDVGMIIHYDISDSLENYVQEAGRAGRDEKIQADCYVLYSEDDLDKHFILLNQSKMSQKEIQQVWMAVKALTRIRSNLTLSALEIARASGWDDAVADMETRVYTAVNALELAGFIRRGQNMPRIYADSILVKNMAEARDRIDASPRFDDATRQQAIRIIASLISAKSKTRGWDGEGTDRVDHISDRLGIVKEDVIRVIGLLREEQILADAKDLSAYLKKGGKAGAKSVLSLCVKIENFLYAYLKNEEKTYNLKEMNGALQEECGDASILRLGDMLNYLAIKRLVKRKPEMNRNHVTLNPCAPPDELREKAGRRHLIADFILDYLYAKTPEKPAAPASPKKPATSEKSSLPAGTALPEEENAALLFSVLELKDAFPRRSLFTEAGEAATAEEIEDALYYLLKAGTLIIEGGFLVIYNAMRISRLANESNLQYRKEHYAQLAEYYENKRQQIHIIGEYARRLQDDSRLARDFVNDYFTLGYEMFLSKYFRGRKVEISQNITPGKFRQLFGELSPAQLEIIRDQKSDRIVVAAGPGSGRTKLLVHKLASLYIMEDVKHEQMLMLTFSRAAATEFKLRLTQLIGGAANFIQITTFHSYCFDLLGKVGDLKEADQIVARTVKKIGAGEVDLRRLTRTVLVIDEAQDMNAAEYALVSVLLEKNSNLRIIAVGDDDQNIYAFRGSDSAHFAALSDIPGAKKYELIDNYRSRANIVAFANQFAAGLSHRFKTQPIRPMTGENGVIHIRKLRSVHIETAVVGALLDIRPAGRTCVMTRTNREALTVAGLLRQEGLDARLIQGQQKFSLYDLAELRDFITGIETDGESFDAEGESFGGEPFDSYTISDELWDRSIAGLRRKYAGSANLPGVLRLLEDFALTHKPAPYKSDLKQFIRESEPGDLTGKEDGVLLVSTIHQTKGREFDHVFLALSAFPGSPSARRTESGTGFGGQLSDEDRRALYVAVTRAKESLYIFCQSNIFDHIQAAELTRAADTRDYPAPSRICLQLGHKDVNLGSFATLAPEIALLRSGQELRIRGRECCLDKKTLFRFSAKFCAEMDKLRAEGYAPDRAYIRHILFWRPKDQENPDDREKNNAGIRIILPDVEFLKGAF